ncbi:hypothetical protein KPL78_19305 [Roseomonas sp. HJA6]|uniref:Uncharacterized protein n=1 Tax=Roseomonas alba TaxID=2846776 RepID=A0ABS7ACI8_9PROT|nr:hypothetical protein [Neoroseomonas alba]MBW6400017.1 hypothetical protein [Neoroseomonas alba]
MSMNRRARGGVSFLVSPPPQNRRARGGAPFPAAPRPEPRNCPRGRVCDALLLALALWVVILWVVAAIVR